MTRIEKVFIDIKDYLSGDRLLHTMRVVEKVETLSELYNLTAEDKQILVKAAELHDIGYSEKVIRTGFHPLDGYLYLKNKVDIHVAITVLLHSLSEELIKYQLEEVQAMFFKEYQVIKDIGSINQLYIDIISMADMIVDSHGSECTAEERYNDIVERYGKEDYRVRHSKIKIIKF